MQFHFSKVFQQFVSAFSMRILRPQQGKGGKITKSQIIPSFFLLELVQGQQKHLRPPPCTLLSPCSHQSQEEGKIKVSRRRSIVVLLLASHPSQRLLYELSSRSETPVALPFPIPNSLPALISTLTTLTILAFSKASSNRDMFSIERDIVDWKCL